MTKQWNFDLFIDGKWDGGEAGGKQIDVLNPTTEEVVGTVPEASTKDAARAIEAARRAFDEGPWPWMKPAQRAGYLRTMAQILRSRAAELRELIVAEVGSRRPLRVFNVARRIRAGSINAQGVGNVPLSDLGPGGGQGPGWGQDIAGIGQHGAFGGFKQSAQNKKRRTGMGSPRLRDLHRVEELVLGLTVRAASQTWTGSVA